MINMLPNEQLRRERQRRGWSRQYVAEQIGVADPKTIGRWERGVAFPSSYFLQRLCTLYGMFAQDLGLFPAEHQASIHAGTGQPETPELTTSADAGKTPLAHEFISHNHMQRISDGIIWASLGLRPNVSDLLGRWGTLLDISASDMQQ
ncbi:MAG TPA: helix-turn-helix transcriptional regulator [Ktedonobacteraceae bacterium]|nr:helix-turn-helix transcriptional regulator [Ktedonobacteraceae bacterium]